MRKLLALAVCVALIVTSLGVCLTAFADSGFTVKTTFDNSDIVSDNLLSGNPFYTDRQSAAASYSTSRDYKSASLLTDSNYNNFSTGLKFWNGTNSTFTYVLGSYFTVTQVGFATAKDAGENVSPVASFAIYVGDEEGTLYTNENKIVDYVNSGSDTEFLFDLDASVTGNYIGFKILDSGNESVSDNVYVNEFAAYGTNNSSMSILDSIPSNNLVSGMAPYRMINSNGVDHIQRYGTVSNGGSNLTVRWSDGNGLYPYSLRIWNGIGMRMEYDLGNNFDVSRIMLASGGTQDANSCQHLTKWKAYVSSSKAHLFDAENSIGFAQTDEGTTSLIEALDFTDVHGRYVGIEIIECAGSTGNVYITEVGIYGEISSAGMTEYNPLGAQNNVLNGLTTLKYKQGSAGANFAVREKSHGSDNGSNTYDVSTLFNNSLTEVYALKFWNNLNPNPGVMVFATDEEYTVDKVLVSAKSGYAVSYIAYVSDSEDTLFNNENVFAVCKNEDQNSFSAVKTEYPKTGSYFGIKFTGKENADYNLMLYEIGFYECDNFSKDTAAAAEGKNLLDGKTMYFTQGNANVLNVSTPTVQEHDGRHASVSYLTNDLLFDVPGGNIGGSGLKFWNGDNARVIYDLGASVNVAEVLIAGGSKTGSENNTMAIKNYAIYVSDSTDTLFNIANQVAYSYNFNNDAAEAFRFNSDVTGSYLGIYVYDGCEQNSNLYLGEIALYGNYATAAYTIVNEPAEDTLKAYGENALNGKTADGITDSTGILTDGSIYNADTVTAADADGTQIVYDLNTVQSVDKILVGSNYDLTQNVAPVYYKVYIGNSSESLFTSSAVIEYYNVGYRQNSGQYAASVQLFDLAESVQGRYVGFEFISAGLGTGTLTLSELAVYSTVEIPFEGSITTAANVYVDGIAYGAQSDLPAGLLNGIHSVVVYNAGGSYEVYLVKDGVFTYRADLADLFTNSSVAMRDDTPYGMRFVVTAPKSVLYSAETVKYGMAVAKSAEVKDGAPVLDSDAYESADAVAYDAASGKRIVYAEDGSNSSFSAGLYNFAQKHYLNYYSVRPYIVLNVGGDNYTVYGTASKSRIYDTATSANLSDYSTEVDDYINMIRDNSSITDVSLASIRDIFPDGADVDALLEDSVTSEGNRARLARVIAKAMGGEDITLGVLGGSITQGYSADSGKAYADRLREWLQNTFNVNVKLVNAGIGSTTSVIGVHRIQKDLLDYNPDLVILEYAVNETDTDPRTRETYENCIRRILQTGDDTALILLFTVKHSGENNQAAESAIGTAYSLPMISYKDGVYPMIEDGTLAWADISPDSIHPNNYGHQMITALLTHFLAGVIDDIDSISTVVPEIPAAINGETYMNATLYTAETLPDEWVEQYGSMQIVHDAYHQFPHGWKATYTDGNNHPMIVNIPSAKRVTMLVLRVNNTKAVNAAVVTETASGTVTRQNVLNYLNNNYADAIDVYSGDTSEPLKVSITPNTRDTGEYFVLLGIMVAG